MFYKVFAALIDKTIGKTNFIGNYHLDETNNILLLEISSTVLDIHNTPYISTSLNNVLKNFKDGTLIIDLGKVDHVDSSFLGVLLSIYGKLNKQNSKLSLINLCENVRKIFCLLGFENLFLSAEEIEKRPVKFISFPAYIQSISSELH